MRGTKSHRPHSQCTANRRAGHLGLSWSTLLGEAHRLWSHRPGCSTEPRCRRRRRRLTKGPRLLSTSPLLRIRRRRRRPTSRLLRIPRRRRLLASRRHRRRTSRRRHSYVRSARAPGALNVSLAIPQRCGLACGHEMPIDTEWSSSQHAGLQSMWVRFGCVNRPQTTLIAASASQLSLVSAACFAAGPPGQPVCAGSCCNGVCDTDSGQEACCASCSRPQSAPPANGLQPCMMALLATVAICSTQLFEGTPSCVRQCQVFATPCTTSPSFCAPAAVSRARSMSYTFGTSPDCRT